MKKNTLKTKNGAQLEARRLHGGAVTLADANCQLHGRGLGGCTKFGHLLGWKHGDEWPREALDVVAEHNLN
jgi:hypothetical protein